MSDQIIETKVKEFIDANKMFTSVDIANAIKRDKTWVRNSDVAVYLRSNVVQISMGQYNSIIISVAGNQKAKLYYPIGSDPDTYTDRNQTSLTPQDVGIDPNTLVTPSINQSSNPINTINNVQSISQGQQNDSRIKIRPDLRARLRIPASLVKKLNLNPGDHVDKSKILVNNKDIYEKLIVQKDGRIAISRECIAWGDGPVYATVKNDMICFEKC